MGLVEDARLLTTPRPFEPDYQKHLARLAEVSAARERLANAGYEGHADWLALAGPLTCEDRRERGSNL